jgi:hypothetical protein
MSHLDSPWSTWSSSSSVYLLDLHVVSLILLLRIRLTRRYGVCWSEPRGIPSPAYIDGRCASLSQGASQDWHRTIKLMLDEEYSPEGVNPGREGANPAWGEIIRPGLGKSRPGPAGTFRRGSPAAIGNPGRPRNAGLGQLRPGERPRPFGVAAWRRGGLQIPAWARRPSRGRKRHTGPAGKKGAGPEARRPSWHGDALAHPGRNCSAGPACLIPA